MSRVALGIAPSPRRLMIFVALVVLVCVAVGLWMHSRTLSYVQASASLAGYKKEHAFWKTRIEAVGGPLAYAEFADTMHNATSTHEHAHAFGEALYDVEGMNGVSVCDLRFFLGCLHTFFARAVAEHGLSGLPEINAACGEPSSPQSLLCHHGIGHGIIAYVGYSFDDLERALALCDALPSDPFRGCDVGAFMEFNQQSMLASDAKLRDPSEDWTYPCDEVGTGDQTICYFYQPQWWASALEAKGETGVPAFEKIGTLCDALASATFRQKCFEGTGHMIPFNVTDDPGLSRTYCDAMSNDAGKRLSCRGYAANMFFLVGESASAEAMCEGLTNDALRSCRAYAETEKPSDLPSAVH